MKVGVFYILVLIFLIGMKVRVLYIRFDFLFKKKNVNWIES